MAKAKKDKVEKVENINEEVKNSPQEEEEEKKTEPEVTENSSGNAKTVLGTIGLVLLFVVFFAAGYFFGKDGLKITITYASSESEVAADEPLQNDDSIVENVDDVQDDETTIDTEETIAEENGISSSDVGSDSKKESSTSVDPTKYNTAQALEFFNNAMNKVRKEKPGFNKVKNQTYTFTSNSASDTAVNALTNIAKAATKGDEKITVKKGIDNTDYFASDSPEWASKLKPSDVKYVKITRAGDNYKVTLRMIDGDVDPKGGDKSPYSRFFGVITKEDVAKQLSGFTIKTNLEDLTVNYRGGYIEAIIDKDGNLIAADYEVLADLIMNNPKIALFNLKDLTVVVDYKGRASNFDW